MKFNRRLIVHAQHKKMKPHQTTIRETFMTYKAMNHPIRQRIIEYLESVIAATVTDIVFKLRMDQPIISQHLKILRRAKLVSSRRSGKKIYYKADHNNIQLLRTTANDISCLKMPSFKPNEN